MKSQMHKRAKALSGALVLFLLIGGVYWRGWFLTEGMHSALEALQIEQSRLSEGKGMAARRGAIDGQRSQAAVGWFTGAPLGNALERQATVGGVVTTGAVRKGRVAVLNAAKVRGWGRLREGAAVDLPAFEGESVSGVVNLRREEMGWVRLGGDLLCGEGTFSLNLNANRVSGVILNFSRGVGFQVRTEPGGEVLFVERPLSRLICWPRLPVAAAEAQAADPALVGGGAAVSDTGVPQVNTRPGARGLIYINFEGETVADTSWNGGKTIVAAPARLSAAEILEVVARVAEDYAPFDMAVSTMRADYDAAKPGTRMRMIVTPTTTALPNSGGVAMMDSWAQAGTGELSSSVPGWVFMSSTKAAAEGVSHEVGHTLGLSHDGSSRDEYYDGHGGDTSVPTSWAPIMGKSYFRSMTQWSKGQYARANNLEDDLAVIAKKANRVGYRQNAGALVQPLGFSGEAFAVSGTLLRASEPDTYTFATLGGRMTAAVKPQVAAYANADLRLELKNSSAQTVAVSDPQDALEAALSVDLPEGVYQLVVSAAGTSPPPAGGYVTGYSAYGSIGQYALSGSVAQPVEAPTMLSRRWVNGVVGKPFPYQLELSSGAELAGVTGEFPPGVSWDTSKKTLSGVPLVSGLWSADFTLVQGGRRVVQTLTTAVMANALPAASGNATGPLTLPDAPWHAVSAPMRLPGGAEGMVAESGVVGNERTSRLRYVVHGPCMVNFWWAVSSEMNCDVVECCVNGVRAADARTGAPLVLSGEADWTSQSVHLESGVALLEFVYKKDFSLSEGQDRAWVFGVEVGQLPEFKLMPSSQRLEPRQSTIVLAAQVEGAKGYSWKKDGVAVVDSVAGGHRVAGSSSATLRIEGAGVEDSGSYTLEASNSAGVEVSRPAVVSVPGAPLVTQPIASAASVRPGDTIFLSVGAASARPLFVLWSKDGVPVRWTQSLTFQLRNAAPSMSGNYSATLLNAYGAVSAGTVAVRVY